jgi:tetratricopeptide (TPR) repeat protein
MSTEWMVRRGGLGRAVLTAVLGLGIAGSVACGQFATLKARKHFKDGNGLYQQQDYRRAAAEYEEVIKANPDAIPEVYFFLGNSYDQLYKPARKGEAINDAYLQDALKNYQISVEKLKGSTDPNQVQIWKRSLQYLAAVYATDKLNEPEKAEPVVKQLIDVDPKDTANYTGLAKIYEDAGKLDEAEGALKQAEAAAPNDPSVASQIGEFYNRRGEFDKAMASFEKMTTLEPNNPQNYYNLAVRFEEKTRKDYTIKAAQKADYVKRGMAAVDKALEIRPDYFEALTYKGLMLRQAALIARAGSPEQKRLMDEAEKFQKKAIEIQNLKSKGVGATD